ncbi:transporter substrate-binding domain-containing protein, partial [Streptococcus sobrinus]
MNHIKKISFSLILALAILFGGLSRAKADQYLRVGMEAAYAPFNWTQNDDSNGAVPIEGSQQYANGYDVQIGKKIAKGMGKKLLVVKTKWDGLLPALTSKKIDLIIAGMSPTEERKKEINFSNSYYT